jgi:hypothetical protein
VQNPVDQKDPTDQGVGGRDPDDYPAEGAVPVGEAPVHRTKKGQGSIPRGIKKEEP